MPFSKAWTARCHTSSPDREACERCLRCRPVGTMLGLDAGRARPGGRNTMAGTNSSLDDMSIERHEGVSKGRYFVRSGRRRCRDDLLAGRTGYHHHRPYQCARRVARPGRGSRTRAPWHRGCPCGRRAVIHSARSLKRRSNAIPSGRTCSSADRRIAQCNSPPTLIARAHKPTRRA